MVLLLFAIIEMASVSFLILSAIQGNHWYHVFGRGIFFREWIQDRNECISLTTCSQRDSESCCSFCQPLLCLL